jgi:hypothetical protein
MAEVPPRALSPARSRPAAGARDAAASALRRPRLLDRVRDAIHSRHYSRRTEKAYVGWVRRYILFHGKRHPAELGAAEVTAYLSSLAVQDKVAASTQNQALSALLFLYRVVLERDLPWSTTWSAPGARPGFPWSSPARRCGPSSGSSTGRSGSWPS